MFRRRSAATMLFGGAGELMPAVGSIVSSAVGQAHAHLAGSGLGTFLLAEEEIKPPNIYGPIAQG